VAADWHELMIRWCMTQPFIARANEQWDLQCSTHRYHRPNQSH